MSPRDLPALLAGVDLKSLADLLLGGHRGHGTGARWPSPVPNHPQTGQTPPMSIFTDRTGTRRWTCWATGRSGTAIDLVATARGLSVGAAIDWLAARHGHSTLADLPAKRPVSPPPRVGASGELLEHVAACQRLLWTAAGRPALRWLTEVRRLCPDVLAANQVGFDPGPRRLRRARGLPDHGPGILLPSFDAAGDMVYAQLRYLDPDRAGRGKYDNPTAVHGTRPRLAWPRPTGPGTGGPVVICEGLIDALTVIGVGQRAVALLAAGDASGVSDAVATIDAPLVVAVDNDTAGNTATATLIERLNSHGRRDVTRLRVPGDINDLATRTGPRFAAVFHASLRGSRRPPSRGRDAILQL